MVNLHTADKLPIVLDIGSAFTKAGYAGESVPICIVPTVVHASGKEIWLRDVEQEDELRGYMRTFLMNIYLKKLLLSMNERSVIICESLVSSLIWKKALTHVLLVDFDVPSVVFAPRHLLSLYTLGVSSALVLQSGYTDTVVLPIFENMVLLNAWQALPLGSHTIEQNLSKLISETGSIEKHGKTTPFCNSAEILSQRQLEDIKVRTCFTTSYSRAKTLHQLSVEDSTNVQSPDPPKDVYYPLKGDTVLYIPGRIREMASEVLYDRSGEETLAHMVLDSIIKCPVDTRKALASNIILIGGNAMLPGFKHRLQQELQQLCKEYKYSSKMSIDKFCFHTLPVRENYTAWLGGAILGTCGNLESYTLTKAQYEASGHCVPDWSNFDPDSIGMPNSPRTM